VRELEGARAEAESALAGHQASSSEDAQRLERELNAAKQRVDDLDREKNAVEAKRHELAQAMLDLTSQKDTLTEELVAMNAAEAAHEKRIADLEAALKGKEDEAARAS
jgi:chromosome segregation ATPase